jgi:hypothetical protein
MDGFPVLQQDNAKVAIVHLGYLAPASNTPICLNYLPNWRIDGALDPCVLNQRTIRTLTYRLEITRDLHATKLTERTGVSVAA